MSAIEKKLVEAAKQALAVIDDLAVAAIAVAPPQATTTLRAISAITKAVKAGFDRQILPSEVLAVISDAAEWLESNIAANDRAALIELDKKFPVAPPSNQPLPNTRDIYDVDPRVDPKP